MHAFKRPLFLSLSFCFTFLVLGASKGEASHAINQGSAKSYSPLEQGLANLTGKGAAPLPQTFKINSLYGTATLNNNLIRALIAHPAMKRLRAIDQAGPARYFRSLPAYSLFDHALGVLVLLNRFQQPIKEQIAGMLEPVSHTVFAHQGTLYLRPKGSKLPFYLASQQDFMKKTGLLPWLQKANLKAVDVNPVSSNFKALYRNPPLLSVLEIEMTLRLGFTYKLLSRNDIESILTDLRFGDGQWYFVTEKSAARLARMSLYFAEQYWGAHQNYVMNRWVAAAIKRAVDLKILSVNEVRFGTDKAVLQKLMTAKDKVIHGLMIQCRQPFRFYDVVTGPLFDDLYKPEFRGLNPLVKKGDTYVRLTAINGRYKKSFDALRLKFYDGIKIKFKKPDQNQTRFQSFKEEFIQGTDYKLGVSFPDSNLNKNS